VNAAPPALAEFALKDAIVGAGLLIVNTSPADVPPPGVGLKTDICAVPALAISAVVIAACKFVFDTKVVGRAVPFHSMVDDETKFAPVTLSVKLWPPAPAEVGFREPAAREGVGLDEGP
jgi:hypothetical protein